MPEVRYNWKRFWCQREQGYRLAPDGYLWDPDAEHGNLYNPDVRPLAAITTTPCLVLLGEPGMGKSDAMRSEHGAVRTGVTGAADEVVWLDLRRFGSEERLIATLVDEEAYQRWHAGDGLLHLFVDSLDEGLLRVETIGACLIDELQKVPRERLRLRIACRTADWPLELESELGQLFGEDAVAAYEILPLRHVDVLEAARTERVDAKAFLAAVHDREAAPLAARPITLRFLLGEYAKGGSLPARRSDLYDKGCLKLCEELKQSHQLRDRLSAEQRLSVAQLIMAAIVICGRYAIWTGLRGDEGPEDLPIWDVVGAAVDSPVPVTEATVREVLDTGLFSSRGADRFGPAHQTYGEFLAARHLAEHNVPLGQIRDLLLHQNRVVPQLRQVGAWLACIRADVHRLVIETDPEVLLRSDIAAATPIERESLVSGLLQQYDAGEAIDARAVRYDHLGHDRLASQLRPYILAKDKGIVVRRVAIEMAEQCRVAALESDLLAVALDQTEETHIRVQAAEALVEFGSSEAKKSLRPLALGESGNDPDDELKGYGLLATWPEHISAPELFSTLTDAKRPSLVGAYATFTYGFSASDLREEDIPHALAWAAQHPYDPLAMDRFHDAVDAVILRAWGCIDAPGVLDALADAVVRLAEAHHWHSRMDDPVAIADAIAHNTDKRRALLDALVSRGTQLGLTSGWTLLGPIRFAERADVPWMCERATESTSEAEGRFWSDLIVRSADWRAPSHLDAIRSAVQRCPAMAAELAELGRRVGRDLLADEEAHPAPAMTHGGPEAPRQADPTVDAVWLSEHLTRALDAVEGGDLSAWWKHVCHLLRAEPQGGSSGHPLEIDLTQLPGWEYASLDAKRRAVHAAHAYVAGCRPDEPQQDEPGTFHLSTLAGVKALALLYRESPPLLATLPDGVWRTWCAAVASYPACGSAETELQSQLLGEAYRRVPEEATAALLGLLESEQHQERATAVIEADAKWWGGPLAEKLASYLGDARLTPPTFGSLLRSLLLRGSPEARRVAEERLRPPLAQDEDGRSKALLSASSLLSCTDDAGWRAVWRAMTSDPAFGCEIIQRVAHSGEWHGRIFLGKLNAQAVADLYLWTVEQFPLEGDPEFNGGTVPPRVSVAWWRDRIPGHLAERATPEACEALRAISVTVPNVRYRLPEARERLRQVTWVPPEPATLLALIGNPQSRLVRSADELLEIVLGSLGRLEKRLHSETPAARDIWDRHADHTWCPVDEEDFSDYVARHLQGDLVDTGVVINREVQIRRRRGHNRGQRTDILVQAVPLETSRIAGIGVATVVVEVKGCWHQELHSAMKTQLVERYLAESRCRHGLYLVGWFYCSEWPNGGGRDIEQARQELDAQATLLSQGGTSVRSYVMDTSLR